MNKITKQELIDYVSEVEDFEKEHHKYSSFYCWTSHTFTQIDIDDLAKEGIDASDFLDVCVNLNGMWDDSWGTEWNDPEFSKVEDYEEVIPEKIIPAHVVTKRRHEKFEYNWE